MEADEVGSVGNRQIYELDFPRLLVGKLLTNPWKLYIIWLAAVAYIVLLKPGTYNILVISMRCPYCGGTDTRVIDKRDTDGGSITRRRRECLDCRKRCTTYERAETLDLFVFKKDQRREAFDRQKLKRNIMKACEKRAISQETIGRLIGHIEQQLISLRKSEVESRVIGELVMDGLKELDQVAYIRFASVYRDFKDVADFEKELEQLARNGIADKT